MDLNENQNITEEERFVEFLLNTYYGRRNNLNEKNLSELKKFFLQLLEAKKKIFSPDIYTNLQSIINDFNEMFKDQKVLEDFKNGIINKKDLLNRILAKNEKAKNIGDNSRKKYDMSDLYNSTLIFKDKKSGANVEKIVINSSTSSYESIDQNGRKIGIKKYGELRYKEWNGVDAYLSIYKIQITDWNNEEVYNDFVYSNININKLDDEEYRKLVFSDLLNKDNIQNSNCGGYIGEIVKSKEDECDRIKEEQTSDGYEYRINENYVLQYDSTAASAAMNMPVTSLKLRTISYDDGKNNNTGKNDMDLEIL